MVAQFNFWQPSFIQKCQCALWVQFFLTFYSFNPLLPFLKLGRARTPHSLLSHKLATSSCWISEFSLLAETNFSCPSQCRKLKTPLCSLQGWKVSPDGQRLWNKSHMSIAILLCTFPEENLGGGCRKCRSSGEMEAFWS